MYTADDGEEYDNVMKKGALFNEEDSSSCPSNDSALLTEKNSKNKKENKKADVEDENEKSKTKEESKEKFKKKRS